MLMYQPGGFNTIGQIEAQFNQPSSSCTYTGSVWGGVASPTGYRIAFTGNMAAGSFMRSYVVT